MCDAWFRIRECIDIWSASIRICCALSSTALSTLQVRVLKIAARRTNPRHRSKGTNCINERVRCYPTHPICPIGEATRSCLRQDAAGGRTRTRSAFAHRLCLATMRSGCKKGFVFNIRSGPGEAFRPVPRQDSIRAQQGLSLDVLNSLGGYFLREIGGYSMLRKVANSVPSEPRTTGRHTSPRRSFLLLL